VVPVNKNRNDHPAAAAAIDSITGAAGFGYRLLAVLGCPPNLSYLLDGLARTLAIIRAREELFALMVNVDVVFGCSLAALESRIESIIARRDILLLGMPAPGRITARMSRATSSAGHPLRNYCLSTCVYWCGLFYTNPPGAPLGQARYDSLFSELSIHFLSLTATVDVEAYEQFIGKWAEDGVIPKKLPAEMARFHSRLASAGLAARRLTLPAYRAAYEALSRPAQSETLENRLYIALDRPDADRWDDDNFLVLDDLARLFILTVPGWTRPGRDTEREFSPGSRGGGGGHGSLPDGFVRIAGTGYAQQAIRLDTGEIVNIVRLITEEGASELDEPEDGEIADVADEWITVTEDDPTNPGAGHATRILRSRQQVSHIARHHQQLPLALDLPTQTELRGVVEWLRQLAMGQTVWPSRYPEVPLLIAASLSTGRSIEEIGNAGFRVDDPAPTAPVTYLTTGRVWRILVNGPVYASESHSAGANEHPVSPVIELPDFGSFDALLQRSGISQVAPFELRTPTQKVRVAVDKTLASAAGDDHLTAVMLPRVLFRLLLNASRGDLAIASMLTGQRVAHSATTLHYSTYPTAIIQRVYQAAASAVWRKKIPAAHQDNPRPRPTTTPYYGSRQCPRGDAVRTLIQHLGIPLQKHDVADPREYHNRYTAYLVAAQALGLGFRGVVSPAVSDWIPREGLVTFTDKARADYHRRVSYLPAVIARLLLNYADHRRYMACSYTAQPDAWADSSVFVLWDATKGEFRPFRPLDVDAFSGDYGLPLRSLRHFMRTELVCNIISASDSRGPSVELVDAWMGHWHLGLSPRESGSTFDPRLLKRLANGPVARILRELGVVAYSSRYVDNG
jgi:hypothetical protein